MSNITGAWGSVHDSSDPNGGSPAYIPNRNGFDLVYRQAVLQSHMVAIEDDIREIEASNMSDTEKMFSMQMAMNSWSAVTNLRTNMLKTVGDSLRRIAQNV